MKKLINGKVINIDNIDLFIKATEDMAISKTTMSITSDGIKREIETPKLQEYIYLYNIFYKSMPFPLYAIEDDIKYATLGEFIKKYSENTYMWVKNGLYILLEKESNMVIYFVNNTWSISYVKDIEDNNISIEDYNDHLGYKEYKWLLSKILNKESTSTFYMEMMPKFFDACNNQPMILKWELENILTFGNIPRRKEFRSNRLVDIDNNKEYTIDIYFNGYKETGESTLVWDFVGDNEHYRKKKIKTYNYNCYEKSLGENNIGTVGNKIKKCNVQGMLGLFINLCAIKNSSESNYFSDFKGIVSGNNIVYCINNTLYCGKFNKSIEHSIIAENVELYSYDRGMIYYTKYKPITKKVKQETLYSYNLTDGIKRLCRIQYTY